MSSPSSTRPAAASSPPASPAPARRSSPRPMLRCFRPSPTSCSRWRPGRCTIEPLGDEIRRELRRQGPNAAMGEILEAWEAAVGPEIARNAWPARFQRDGTLIVHAKDAIWGFELQSRAPEISGRLPKEPPLKFVPGPVPEPGSEPAPATPQGAPPATLEQRSRAAEWASAIDDPELRELVARAAETSLARGSG